MLRVDKLTLAILEENIKSILLGELDELPTLKMLFTPIQELRENAETLYSSVHMFCKCEVIETKTVIGGGTTPNRTIPTIALSINIKSARPNAIEKLFRAKKVIGRIENEKFLLDFRTIQKSEIDELTQIIKEIANV